MAESNIGLQTLIQSLNGLGNSATQQQQLGFGQNQALAELAMRQKAQQIQGQEFAGTMDFRNRMLDMYSKMMGGRQNPKDMMAIQGFGQRLGMTQNDPKYLVNGKYDPESAFRDVLGQYSPDDQAKITSAYGSPFPQAKGTDAPASGGGIMSWLKNFQNNNPAIAGIAEGAGGYFGGKAGGAAIGGLLGDASLGGRVGGIGGMLAAPAIGYAFGAMNNPGVVPNGTPGDDPLGLGQQQQIDFSQQLPITTPGMSAKQNAIAPNSTAATRRINRMQLSNGPVTAF
jgi:hypothetical protein